MAEKGVDLSYANGDVDFSALRKAGIGFVILRCGFGSDYPGQQDTQFESNVTKAEASGMPWGVYHYGYARDAAGGRAEAAHALRLIGDRRPAYGVWYDMEDSSTLGGDLAAAAEAFCSAVQAAGLFPGVYANLNWWKNYLTSPVFDRYDRWCAQYNSQCDLEKPYGLWQFTDALTIGGKRFDGNWAYKDYPALTGGKEDDEEMLSYEQFKEYMSRYEKEQAEKPESSWSGDDIQRAKADGIMKGDDNGKFRPRSSITREEAAAVANRTVEAAVKRAVEQMEK